MRAFKKTQKSRKIFKHPLIIQYIMENTITVHDEKIVYCICPHCTTIRKKVDGYFNIIKKGYERNGLARFLCLNCEKWFNEKTGDSMRWQGRF